MNNNRRERREVDRRMLKIVSRFKALKTPARLPQNADEYDVFALKFLVASSVIIPQQVPILRGSIRTLLYRLATPADAAEFEIAMAAAERGETHKWSGFDVARERKHEQPGGAT